MKLEPGSLSKEFLAPTALKSELGLFDFCQVFKLMSLPESSHPEVEGRVLRPGGNVDSWCGKCKMMLAHTIETLVGDKPARVQCNTCKSQHAYKAQVPDKKTRTATTGRRLGSTKAADRYRALVSGKESAAIGTKLVPN